MSKRHTPQEKAKIVLEFLNTGTSAAELCRKHNILPARSRTGRTNSWRAGNKHWLAEGDAARIHTKEVENLALFKIVDLTKFNPTDACQITRIEQSQRMSSSIPVI